MAALVLTLAGMCAVLVWGVHVFRPWPLILQGSRWLAWWLHEQVAVTSLRTAVAPPPLDLFATQGSALAHFGQRMGWWVDGLVTDAGVPDNLVLVALVCLLTWGLAAWAGWWLARHGKPFVALLPSFLLLIIQVYWAPGGIWTLLVFLGALTLLLVLLAPDAADRFLGGRRCGLLAGDRARHPYNRRGDHRACGFAGANRAVPRLQRSVNGVLAAGRKPVSQC